MSLINSKIFKDNFKDKVVMRLHLTRLRRVATATGAVALAAAFMPGLVGAASAAIPDMPQGYPIANLYQKCEQHQATAEGYPDWHYGETARRYLSDGTIQFTNTTKQTVKYLSLIHI